MLLPLLLGLNLFRHNLDIAHEGHSLDLKKVELELDRYLSEVAALDLFNEWFRICLFYTLLTYCPIALICLLYLPPWALPLALLPLPVLR